MPGMSVGVLGHGRPGTAAPTLQPHPYTPRKDPQVPRGQGEALFPAPDGERSFPQNRYVLEIIGQQQRQKPKFEKCSDHGRECSFYCE